MRRSCSVHAFAFLYIFLFACLLTCLLCVCEIERTRVRERQRKRVSRDLEQIGRKSEDWNLGCKLQTANSRRLWKLGLLLRTWRSWRQHNNWISFFEKRREICRLFLPRLSSLIHYPLTLSFSEEKCNFCRSQECETIVREDNKAEHTEKE